jgi:DNA ligase-1
LQSLSAIYEPDVRTEKWIKVKKDYVGGVGVADTFDCVPIGGYLGTGRKAGFISPWLLAVWDEEKEEYQTLCKIMSGMTDDEYAILTKRYKEQYQLAECPNYYNISPGLQPNFYWDAKEVWEIRGADLSISPLHTAAFDEVASGRGIGLRFPRFIRIRDKDVKDCMKSHEVAALYQKQNFIAGAEKEFPVMRNEMK